MTEEFVFAEKRQLGKKTGENGVEKQHFDSKIEYAREQQQIFASFEWVQVNKNDYSFCRIHV